MSQLLSTFPCCFWWFLLGTLLGWLLNKCLCKCTCNPTETTTNIDTPPVNKAVEVPVSTPAPVANIVSEPKVAEPVAVAIDMAAAKAAGFTIKNVDDLTVVEGIGPKISELFKNAGINTFAQLAAASVPQMRKILDEGGSRFRIANPETWAQQAALAAVNKWTELKKLQDELSGGLKK